MTVEIAQDRPHRLDRRVEDGALAYLNHQRGRQRPNRSSARQRRAEYVRADLLRSSSSRSGTVEFGRPFGEGQVAVGDGVSRSVAT